MDREVIGLILALIGLVIVVIVMVLRVKYPMKNILIDRSQDFEKAGDSYEMYNPDTRMTFPVSGGLPSLN